MRKPHIKLNRSTVITPSTRWYCTDGTWCGYGSTPRAAMIAFQQTVAFMNWLVPT